MLTKAERDVMRARADRATVGPWAMDDVSAWSNVVAPMVDEVPNVRIAEVRHLADREFIAGSRSDVLALLDSLDEMEQAARDLSAAVETRAADLPPSVVQASSYLRWLLAGKPP